MNDPSFFISLLVVGFVIGAALGLMRHNLDIDMPLKMRLRIQEHNDCQNKKPFSIRWRRYHRGLSVFVRSGCNVTTFRIGKK